MGIEGVLKVGIAVKDLDKATNRFAELVGVETLGSVEHEPLEMKYDVCNLGNVMIEFVQSTTPGGPLARFINKRGEGLQHITLKVTEIEKEIRRLQEKGVEFVDEVPKEVDSSFGKLRYVFARPDSFNGVLVQLMEVL